MGCIVGVFFLSSLIKKDFFINNTEEINAIKIIDKQELKEVIEKKERLLNEFYKTLPLENSVEPLEIPTYVERDNQAIHPSVYYDEDRKFGYKWVMAFTPYSLSKDFTENPSIVVSEDGVNWKEPKGLKNPLAITDKPDKIHYSDTEIISNGNELELWYRQSDKPAKLSRILRQKSKDAVNWSKPEIIFDYGTGGFGYGAPSVICKDNVYEIYYREKMKLAEESYVKIKYSENKIKEEAIPVNFEYTEEYKEFVGWHIEFRKIGDKYYALTMAYPKSTPWQGGKLFLFDSDDGVNFKNMKLVLKPTKDGFDNKTIYKSSLVVTEDFINLYYSSISKDNKPYISLIKG